MRIALKLGFVLGMMLGMVAGAFAAEPSSANGVTEPVEHVTLSASVSGILAVKNFKEGDTVKAGQVILELDKTLEEIENTRRGLIADEKKQDYDSTALLFSKTKSVAREEMLKKESEYKVAAAERDIAAEQLRRRLIVAPFTGQITDLHLELGEACQPYQPLARVVDVSRCYFVSNIEAKLAARLQAGQSVQLEVETGATVATVTSKVILISPVADPASGLVKIRTVFDNPEGKIRPGLPARIFIP